MCHRSGIERLRNEHQWSLAPPKLSSVSSVRIGYCRTASSIVHRKLSSYLKDSRNDDLLGHFHVNATHNTEALSTDPGVLQSFPLLASQIFHLHTNTNQSHTAAPRNHHWICSATWHLHVCPASPVRISCDYIRTSSHWDRPRFATNPNQRFVVRSSNSKSNDQNYDLLCIVPLRTFHPLRIVVGWDLLCPRFVSWSNNSLGIRID